MAEGPLPDGRHDALIVDATREGDRLSLELTIVAGAHKGDVVSLTATGIDRDELDLLGVPATIAVVDGRPSVTLEG
jgi:hypothetical protein